MRKSTLKEQFFRILSIDGGGARGILPSRLLENLDEYLKSYNNSQALINNFDLIAGTSTGGIIALGLALGLEPSMIVKLYEEFIPIVFENKRFSWFKGKYDSSLLKSELKKCFGEYKLSDLKADIIVTSVSLQNSSPRLYKTDYFSRNKAREDEKILDIAMATSAAPTFFKAHSSEHSSNLIDGGMCANNPSMLALIDAIHFERSSKSGRRLPKGELTNRISNIAMLSVGTGEQCAMPYDYKKMVTGGKYHWAENVFQIITDSQSKLIDFQIKSLLGDRYKRVNPTLTFASALDDIEAVEYSKNLSDLSSELEDWINLYL